MRMIDLATTRRGLDAVAGRLLYAVVLGMLLLSVALFAVPIAERYSPNHEAALVVAVPLVLVIELCSGQLHRFVDWLLFGHRGDPATASWRLARGLESLDGDAAVPALVEALADTLRLGYVEVLVQAPGVTGTASVAARGKPPGRYSRFPIRHAGRDLGLLAAARHSGPLDQRDDRLLRAAAAQIGVVLHAAGLAADLQRARERMVLSREAERARLRRELHDGVGPTLAGLALSLQAADSADPQRARSLMAQAREDLEVLIGDVRRVVDGLRPPMLDEAGLVGAVTERARAFAARTGWTLHVQADAMDTLPPAVEVAAYRIAAEALTNAARHAGASRCDVRLSVTGGQLVVEVSDDGTGGARPDVAGTGLTSIGERAAELGGTATVTSTASGTRIQARLPLTAVSTDA